MAAVRINVRLPNNAITLHVPLGAYNAMVAEGSWPRGTNSLVYEIGKRVWYIAPDHPDFERLTALFGPENPKAERRWKQELDQRDRSQRALYRHRIVDPEDRLFLPGLVGHTEKAREIGALWDRSAKTWYVSVDHQDAEELAEKYASPAGIRAAAKYHAARTAANIDKIRGAQQALSGSAPPAPAAKKAKTKTKKAKTKKRKVSTAKGSKLGVRAPSKQGTKGTVRWRRRDPGQERL